MNALSHATSRIFPDRYSNWYTPGLHRHPSTILIGAHPSLWSVDVPPRPNSPPLPVCPHSGQTPDSVGLLCWSDLNQGASNTETFFYVCFAFHASSNTHCTVASSCTIASCASCTAGCCVISPLAATSHLPVPPPLIFTSSRAMRLGRKIESGGAMLDDNSNRDGGGYGNNNSDSCSWQKQRQQWQWQWQWQWRGIRRGGSSSNAVAKVGVMGVDFLALDS